MIFRGEVFVTIQNQDGTEAVTHLMPETNRFEDVKQVIWPIQIIFHGQKLDHLGPY